MEHIIGTDIQFNYPTAVAIGKFDSIHLGHRALITEMIKKSKNNGLKTVVFSFYPSPAEVFGFEKYPYVFTSGEKLDILSAPPFNGLDYFIEYPFSREFSQITPESFINEILCGKLNCKLLVAGEGYRFGRGRTGTLDLLKETSVDLGMEVAVFPVQFYEGEIISSSRVRRMISASNFNIVNKLMGRPYFIKGRVEYGKMLGRRIGFPTVNIRIPNSKFIPRDGVYVTGCRINGKVYPSVSNIGASPTLEDTVKKCETYILDFNEQLYNQYVTVYFYSFIRGEIKFDDIEALKKRITEDVKQARIWWSDACTER